MSVVIINPGSGPVYGAEYEDARKNIDVLIKDAGFDPEQCEIIHPEVETCPTCGHTPPALDYDGRYHFDIKLNGRTCEVDMPGLPIDQVRWQKKPYQNIWDFPRLYVDGSSWVWLYATNAVEGHLSGRYDAEAEEDEQSNS